MPIVVEDGTGLPTTNAYASENYFDTDTGDRAYVVVVVDTEAALIRGTTSLEAMYGTRWPGTRTHGRDQGLGWPRTGATDVDDNVIADDEIPIEVIEATIELALRELSSPGSPSPDLAQRGTVRHVRAGSVEVENAANAIATPHLP